jgi:hypothetical protein
VCAQLPPTVAASVAARKWNDAFSEVLNSANLPLLCELLKAVDPMQVRHSFFSCSRFGVKRYPDRWRCPVRRCL